ncbi:hypothetical protein G6F22_020650 [Rhizopus arrhizus]|nr:hypothetical protein G6F22_020650 [Rhizopus arrhizus]
MLTKPTPSSTRMNTTAAPPYRGHEGQQIGDQRQHLFEQAAHQAQHTRDRQDGQHDEVEAGHYCAAMKPLS